MVTYLGSLVQLCCGEGGTLQTYITGICGERSRCLGHTGFAPAHASVLSRSTLLRLQVALQGICLKQPWVVCTSQAEATEVQVLGYSTKARTLSGVPFPGPSGSGDLCLGECTLPRWGGASHPLPGPAALFPGCAAGATTQVCRVSPLGSCSLAGTLLVDVNRPGSQEDLVRNWEPVCSLASETASSTNLSPACLPASGRAWPVRSWLALLWDSLKSFVL